MKMLILLLLFTFNFNLALANIAISPFYLEFDANNNKLSEQVRFTNTSNQVKNFNIKFINFKQGVDGKYTEVYEDTHGNPFAFSFLEFSPHNTSLGPRESQTIRLKRKSMAGMDDGEYVSHLFIQEGPISMKSLPKEKSDDRKLKIDIKVRYGVTIPVIIRKGNLYAEAKIKSAKLDKEKSLVNVKVMREGTKSFLGSLVVKNGDREVGRVNNFRIFLTTPSRVVAIPISVENYKNLKLTINLIEQENDKIISTKDL